MSATHKKINKKSKGLGIFYLLSVALTFVFVILIKDFWGSLLLGMPSGEKIGFLIAQIIAWPLIVLLSTLIIAYLYTLLKMLILGEYFFISRCSMWVSFVIITFLILVIPAFMHLPPIANAGVSKNQEELQSDDEFKIKYKPFVS